MFTKIYPFLLPADYRNEKLPVIAVCRMQEPVKKKLIRDVSFVLLLSYVLFIFNSLTPVLLDVIAHTFWEKEHLANEHKLYGNNHLKAELENAAKQSAKEKPSFIYKIACEEYLQVAEASLSGNINYQYIKQDYPSFKSCFPVSYPAIAYRPPRGLSR